VAEDAVAAAHIQGRTGGLTKQPGGYRRMNVAGQAELGDDRTSSPEPVRVMIVIQRERPGLI